jgi:hypothetical protein
MRPALAHSATRALRRHAVLGVLLCLFCGWASPSRAFSSLFDRLGYGASLINWLTDEESRVEVKDGFLLGTGVESMTHLPNGQLRIHRLRHYTRIRHPQTHQVAVLPEPWEFETTLTLQRSLRLVYADTRLRFRRSADKLFPDYAFSERHAWLFAWDRSVVHSIASGTQLELQSYLAHKPLGGLRYAYPPNAVPIEIVGQYLSVAMQWRVDQFDFDLLLPGGDIHGVSAQIHRTRDVAPFAQDYRIPPRRLATADPLAVVDMRLSSPVKYLFFPHHFFMVFAAQQPSRMVMMWGGDPDADLEAFRAE